MKNRLFLLLSAVLIPLVGALDYLTGYELSFSLFYLAPISIAAWRAGLTWGMVASTAGAVTWGVAEVASGQLYSNPAMYFWNSLIRLGFFVTITYLLSELHKSNAREAESARTDMLTGASNSRHFYELVDAEVARCQRHNHTVSLAYIDLDHFKMVNDRLGHAAGDDLLRIVAATLAKHIRRVDSVARLGGDEFAILFPETPPAAAQMVTQKIHDELGRVMGEGGYPVTASIGVISCVSPPNSSKDLIRMADNLMYEVKNKSRNAVIGAVHQVD